MRIIRAVLALGLVTGIVAAAGAQPAYTLAGQSIRLLVNQAAGGSSDTEARLLAKYLPRYLPGAPNIIVQNLPGAAGVRMLEFFGQLDPLSEPAVAMLPSAAAFRSRAGALDGIFDARTTNWIGSFASSTNVCLVRTDTGVASVADLPGHELNFGILTAGATMGAFATLFNQELGFAIRSVAGYDSIAAVGLAVQRGELDGLCMPYSSYPTLFQPMVEAGTARLLFYIDPMQRDDLETPWLFDLSMTGQQREFLATAVASTSIARPFTMAPGADPALVQAMRTAFAAVVADPAFNTEAAALSIDVRPRTSADLVATVAQLYAMPDDVAVRIRDLFFGE